MILIGRTPKNVPTVQFKEISYQKPREPIVRVIEFLEEYQKSQQLKSRKAVFKAIATAKF